MAKELAARRVGAGLQLERLEPKMKSACERVKQLQAQVRISAFTIEPLDLDSLEVSYACVYSYMYVTPFGLRLCQ